MTAHPSSHRLHTGLTPSSQPFRTPYPHPSPPGDSIRFYRFYRFDSALFPRRLYFYSFESTQFYRFEDFLSPGEPLRLRQAALAARAARHEFRIRQHARRRRPVRIPPPVSTPRRYPNPARIFTPRQYPHPVRFHIPPVFKSRSYHTPRRPSLAHPHLAPRRTSPLFTPRPSTPNPHWPRRYPSPVPTPRPTKATPTNTPNPPRSTLPAFPAPSPQVRVRGLRTDARGGPFAVAQLRPVGGLWRRPPRPQPHVRCRSRSRSSRSSRSSSSSSRRSCTLPPRVRGADGSPTQSPGPYHSIPRTPPQGTIILYYYAHHAPPQVRGSAREADGPGRQNRGRAARARRGGRRRRRPQHDRRAPLLRA